MKARSLSVHLALAASVVLPAAGRVADPAKNFLVIMKDGRVHKNLLMSAAR